MHARRYRTCGQLLDIPHIWCIVIVLFMRPITSQPSVSNNHIAGAGSYRTFMAWFLIIGISIITLLTILIIISGQDPAGQDLK